MTNNGNTPKQLFYRVSRFSGQVHGVEHLEIEFSDSLASGSNFPIRFEWQTSDDVDHWYGGRLKIAAENFEVLDRATRLAKKITRPVESGWNWPVDGILSRLEKMQAVQVVYDSRLSEYVPIDQVPDPSLDRYMDDYRRFDNGNRLGGIRYAVLAASPEDARREIIKAAADDNSCKEFVRADFIQSFIDADMPVWTNGDKAPNTTPARELVALKNPSK